MMARPGRGSSHVAASRLLIAVESPWEAERFVAPIVDLATRLSSEILVAHVAEVQQEDTHESDAKKRGEETLKLLTDRLRDAGLRAEGLMLFSDDVAKAILNTAKARDCSLIVLGFDAEGLIKGIVRRLFANDVTSTILRNTEIPVMLCPAKWMGTV